LIIGNSVIQGKRLAIIDVRLCMMRDQLSKEAAPAPGHCGPTRVALPPGTVQLNTQQTVKSLRIRVSSKPYSSRNHGARPRPHLFHGDSVLCLPALPRVRTSAGLAAKRFREFIHPNAEPVVEQGDYYWDDENGRRWQVQDNTAGEQARNCSEVQGTRKAKLGDQNETADHHTGRATEAIRGVEQCHCSTGGAL
jgi:hypothetical protein